MKTMDSRLNGNQRASGKRYVLKIIDLILRKEAFMCAPIIDQPATLQQIAANQATLPPR